MNVEAWLKLTPRGKLTTVEMLTMNITVYLGINYHRVYKNRGPQKYTWDVTLYIVYTDGELKLPYKNNVIVYKPRKKSPICSCPHDTEANSCTTYGALEGEFLNKLCTNCGFFTVLNFPLKAPLRLSEAHPIASSLIRDTCATFCMDTSQTSQKSHYVIGREIYSSVYILVVYTVGWAVLVPFVSYPSNPRAVQTISSERQPNDRPHTTSIPCSASRVQAMRISIVVPVLHR